MGAIFKILPIILPIAVEVVKLVEGLFGRGQGGPKRDLAVTLVKALVMAAEGVSGKDIVDDAKFSDGIGQIIDGVVAVLNATGKFSAKEPK